MEQDEAQRTSIRQSGETDEIQEGNSVDEQSTNTSGRLPEETVIDNKYRLESWIGEGGMGTVYKCTSEGVDRPLAIKLLRHDFANNSASKKRFESESKVATGLNHPNMVCIYDYGIASDQTPYLVMDFAEGDNLSEILKKEEVLNTERFVNIFGQVCDALLYAHEKGVIHRDIKPSNIIVTRCGDTEAVKVVDFGIAKLLPKGTDVSTFNLTSTGDIFGTPRYMSPEQCQGLPLNHTTDVYALGCVMYEALCGHPPFQGDNAVQLILKHIQEKPKKPTRHGKDVPADLQAIILQCMEKNPAKRFKSMKELAGALRDFGAGKKFAGGASKKRLYALAGSGVAAILLVCGILTFTGGSHVPAINPASINDASWKMYQDAGQSAYDSQHYVEAQAMWTSALQEGEKIFPATDMRLATTLHDLGQLKHIHNNEIDEAEKLFQRCLDIRLKNLKPEDRDIADAYGHLGAVKGEQGKYDEADKLLEKAIATAEKSDKELALHYRDMKARELIDRKDYVKAEKMREELLAIRTQGSNEDSEDMAIAVENMGYIYALQDKYDKALPLYRRALKIREKNNLINDSSYPWLLESLAYSYEDIGDLTRAIQYYEKAITAYEGTDDTESLGDSNYGLAQTYAKKKDFKKAGKYFERAVELRKSREDRDPGAVAEALATQAENFMRQGDVTNTESALTELSKLAKRRGNWVLADCDVILGGIKDMANKKHAAEVGAVALKLQNAAVKD